MRVLIVGAGASVEECHRSGTGSQWALPTMANFAQVMWSESQPYPFLYHYLISLGIEPADATQRALQTFVDLEKSGKANVERFFEFCWANRDRFHATAWNDMLYACFTMPIILIMSQVLFENGKGWRDFKAANLMMSKLKLGDLVINLNYDTIVDMSIEKSGIPFGYVPVSDNANAIHIAKPHGSLNLIVNEKKHSFWFALPSTTGGLVSDTDDNPSASILPPRLNKSYREHPVSKAILDPLSCFRPDVITYWGVGMTESDVGLNELYVRFSESADRIEFINPDSSRVEIAEKIMKKRITHYPTLDQWASDCAIAN